MDFPSDLYYTREHEWARIEDDIAVVGITDYAQGELGDIVFVELPQKGNSVLTGDAFGTIEAVKAVSDMYSPLSGKVVEINAALDGDPMIVNKDPYGDGWMVRLQVTNPSELGKLLDAATYEGLLKEH